MRTAVEPVVRVLDGTCADTAVLGGKGAALDRLIGWGLPVPPTAVVAADLCRSLAAQPDLAALVDRLDAAVPTSADQVDALVAAATIDPAIADAIVAVARSLVTGQPGGRIAVRSSATAEDLEHHSFAGQYHSVLDIDPSDPDAVLGAVRSVLASLWYPAPVAYRAAVDIPQRSVAMAVVLMAMVPATRAGVVFTVDPVGDGSTARVEVVEGLGESLVSGRRTPEVHVVPRDGSAGGGALDEQLAAALELAMSIEARSGVPQDVEFACEATTVWVVQARPITTAPRDDAADRFDDPPDVVAGLDLTTAGIGEMLPGVLAPLRFEVCAHLVEEAFRATFADLGVMLDRTSDRPLLRRVRGRAALDFGLLQEWTARLPGADVGRLEEQYFGSRTASATAPPTPVRRPDLLARFRTEWRTLRSRRRADVDADVAIAAIGELGASPLVLGDLDDGTLAATWVRLVDLAARTMTAELAVAAQAAACYRRLEVLLGRRVGADRAGAVAAELTTMIDRGPPPTPAASAAVFGGPTWAELGRTPPVPPRPAAEADPYADLRALVAVVDPDGGLRASLRLRETSLALEDALEHLGRRERTKAALLQLGGEVRRVHLEVGERLRGRELLADAADVELLSVVEFRAALLDGVAPDRDELVRRRLALGRAESAAPLPARFSGSEPQVEVGVPTGDRLDGWAVSRGRFTGPAVVVRSPDDELPAGAVLVADATDPSWSPLFMRAGAIVLERGGPLSHAAILARELGVPAVTNVAAATRRLAGCTVAVDGDSGIVVVIEEAAP